MTEYELHETVLRIEGVSLAFGDTVILRDINAEIKNITRPGTTTGQIVSILGPSGIGKTQLFKIIAGLQKPTTGRVLLNAKATLVKRGEVGVVAQSYPLFMHRTVLSNLIIAGMQAGLSTSDAKEKSMALLTKFGMTKHANYWPAQLSGGQRQRIAIAQQVMCSEHFLLMDEPFSGLDPLAIQKVRQLIADVANLDDLNTIIVITHDIRAAIALADHIWMVGRQADAQGNVIPGATIVKVLDLIQAELTWHPDITKTAKFDEYYHMVRNEFDILDNPLALL